MASDLVKRLREWAGSYEEGSFDTEEGLMREAADTIEALATRPEPEAGSVVERLRGPLRIHTEEANEAADLIKSQVAQIASLSAKVADVERERDEAIGAIPSPIKSKLCQYVSRERFMGVVSEANKEKARAERLERALKMIAKIELSFPAEFREIARAALQQEGE